MQPLEDVASDNTAAAHPAALDLWRELATTANTMALRMAEGVSQIRAVEVAPRSMPMRSS